jgi:antirestriction protein ArdC
VKRHLYAEVSARIIQELERGAVPWLKPWAATAGHNVPQNAISGRAYSGCNVILLWLARNRGWATPRFLTYKQAVEAGGNVRKGEHGTKVYFVKQLQLKDSQGHEAETRLSPDATGIHGLQRRSVRRPTREHQSRQTDAGSQS